MLTANTNHLNAREPMDDLSGRLTDKMKLLLKYARKITSSGTQTTELSEATLRDIGISTSDLRCVSDKFRFNDELDRFRIQCSINLPR